jgi:hypothetical protein
VELFTISKGTLAFSMTLPSPAQGDSMWNQNYTVEKQLEIGVIEPFVKNPK